MEKNNNDSKNTVIARTRINQHSNIKEIERGDRDENDIYKDFSNEGQKRVQDRHLQREEENKN